jgi:HEAT repeat protein
MMKPKGAEKMDKSVAELISDVVNPDSPTRRESASALADLGERRAVQPLINVMLNDREFDMRAFAATCLGEIGDSRAIEPLVATLHDSYAYVRAAAAGALGDLGDSRALPELERTARKDSDRDSSKAWNVRDTAKQAINKIRG